MVGAWRHSENVSGMCGEIFRTVNGSDVQNLVSTVRRIFMLGVTFRNGLRRLLNPGLCTFLRTFVSKIVERFMSEKIRVSVLDRMYQGITDQISVIS